MNAFSTTKKQISNLRRPLFLGFVLLLGCFCNTVQAQKDSLVFKGKSKPQKINLRSDKNDLLIIDWVSPSFGEVGLTNGLLEIKLKIFSSFKVENKHVTVFLNQERLGSKMDVSGLFGQQNEFNYSNKIKLVEGVNEIKVQVAKDTVTKDSEPIIVHKQGGKVTVQPMGGHLVNTGNVSIYWWTDYDPVALNGEPYTSKDELLPVKFKILTTEALNKDNVILFHNEIPTAPSPTSSLVRDNQGNYSFTDNIRLREIRGANEIYLFVRTQNSIATSAKLYVNFSPFRPNLHLLSIGTATNLQYTLKDAQDFVKLFKDQGERPGNRLFSKVMLDTLIGEAATADEIKGTIEELKVRYFTGSIKRDDVILAFISSHGFLLNGDFRIQGDNYSPARQRSTSVSFRNDVINVLEAIPCKKIIMIDACHSGGARANSADINFEINKLNGIEKGVTVFASSRGEEQSYEDPVWQNGAFTSAIIKGLAGGEADKDKNSIVTLHELSDYVSKEVSKMVKKVKKMPQNPLLVNDELGDVAIYIVE